MVVSMRWNAIDLIVRGHHGLDLTFPHRAFKRLQKGLSDDALRIVAWGHVGSAFGLTVDGEMFCSGQDVRLTDPWTIALEAMNCGYSHTRYEKRIFSVSLFGSTPTRIACQIEHWSQAVLGTARTDLARN